MKSTIDATAKQDEKWHDLLAIVNQYPNFQKNKFVNEQFKLVAIRFITENIFIFLLQYTGLMFSTLSTGMNPVWISSGTACAFLLLRGYAILPGIWLGTFFAFYPNTTFISALIAASIFTLQPCLILILTYRLMKCPMPNISSGRSVCAFMLICVLTSAISSVLLISIFHTNHPVSSFLQWWLANFSGTIVYTIAIITWDTYFSDEVYPQSKSIYFILVIMTILMCCSTSPVMIMLYAFSIIFLISICHYYHGHISTIACITLLTTTISTMSYIGTAAFITAENYLHNPTAKFILRDQ